jgi:hypothetical protein
VVTARVQTDAFRSLHHQRQDLHKLTYPVPLERSGLILLLVVPSDVVEVGDTPTMVVEAGVVASLLVDCRLGGTSAECSQKILPWSSSCSSPPCFLEWLILV